jgi:hypothetical protein
MDAIRHGYRQSKRRVLVSAALFTALTAPSAVLVTEGSALSRFFDLVSIFACGLMVLAWCYYDSLERGERLGAGYRVLIVIFGLLALFIYLLRTRGLVRGLRASGMAVLFIVGLMLIAGVVIAVALVASGLEE